MMIKPMAKALGIRRSLYRKWRRVIN